MKSKIFKITTLSLLLLLGFGGTYSAADSPMKKEKSGFKEEQITDLNVLYKRALEGITDLPESDIKRSNAFSASNLDESNPLDAQVNSTSQLLEVKEKGGEVVETYATTTFYVAQDEQDQKAQEVQENLISPMTTITDGEWDDTYGVRAYSTIVFDKVYNGVVHWDLSYVRGGWEYDGVGNYTLSNRRYRVGQDGASRYGTVGDQVVSFTNSSNSFYYDAPSWWLPVEGSTGYSEAGVTTNVTITRSGSSWGLEFTNNAR